MVHWFRCSQESLGTPSVGAGPFPAYERGFSSNATILLQGPCEGPQSTSVNKTEPSLQESQASEEDKPWNRGEEGGADKSDLDGREVAECILPPGVSACSAHEAQDWGRLWVENCTPRPPHQHTWPPCSTTRYGDTCDSKTS